MRRKADLFLLSLLAVAMAFGAVVAIRRAGRSGRTPGRIPDLHTLVAWNNEMIRAHGRGDLARAAFVARKIVSRPEWSAFIPANAVLGSVLAEKGDYAAAEPFFRAALAGQGVAAPQPVVLNDCADTLLHLGRYAEAEALARRAVAESGGKEPLFRMTLDQILRAAGKCADEANSKEDET